MMHIMIVNAYSNLLAWKIGVYEGENKIALNIEYFQIPTILYPLIRLDSWIKGSKCRRCDMEVLRGMGMVV